jgi:hypothetical protein
MGEKRRKKGVRFQVWIDVQDAGPWGTVEVRYLQV